MAAAEAGAADTATPAEVDGSDQKGKNTKELLKKLTVPMERNNEYVACRWLERL